MNYNIIDVASKISCDTVKSLNNLNNKKNNYIYNQNIDIYQYHHINNNDYKYKNFILPSIKVDNKSCLYERPIYDNGEWEKNFLTSFSNCKDVVFNIQTKMI